MPAASADPGPEPEPEPGGAPSAGARTPLLRRRGVVAGGLAGGAALAAGGWAAVLRSKPDEPEPPYPDTFVGLGAGPAVVLASVPTTTRPDAVAVGENGVWVANAVNGSVLRVDPSLVLVTEVTDVGGAPVAVAVGAGHVWVLDVNGDRLVQLEPVGGEVVAEAAVPGAPVAVAVGPDGAVWVACAGDRIVARLDPSTLGVDAEVALGGPPRALVVRDGATWVGVGPADGRPGGEVLLLATDDGRAPVEVHREPVVGDPVGLAAVGDEVWVAGTGSNAVTRLGPGGVTVARLTARNNPLALAAGPEGVWVLYGTDGILALHDPVTGAELAAVQPSAGPVAIAAAGDGTAWVVSRAELGRVTKVGPG